MKISQEKIFQEIVEKRITKEQALHLLKGVSAEASAKSYPLSEGQKLLFIFSRLAPESYAYNVPQVFKVCADIEPVILKEAIRLVMERHPLLRTVFRGEGDTLFQEVLENLEVYFILKDLSFYSEPAIETEIKAVCREPFDLEKGPLFKAYLFTLPNNEMVLLLNFHHIVVDGISLQVILDDLQEYYHALKSGQSYQPQINASYEDFVYWQEDMLKSERGIRDLRFWQEQFTGETNPLDLYFDHAPTVSPTYSGASHVIQIGESLAREIDALSIHEETTVFSVLLAAFNVLLYRYSKQEELSVVTPVAGRPETKFEGIVGNFVNLVIIKSYLSGGKEFRTLLRELADTSIDALEHGYYPFSKIIEEIGRKHNKTAYQLFKASFYLQNWKKPITRNIALGKKGFILEPYGAFTQEGEFDLTLDVFPVEKGYKMWFKYNPDLFEKQTIAKMAGHYNHILEEVVKDPGQTISNIDLLTNNEKHQILVEWNNTSKRFPLGKGVHELFEEQTEQTPGAVAIIQEDRVVTYRELCNMAAQLANYLQHAGVKPGDIVGVFLERSIEMVAGMLALFKAGCAFVPLDPEYPPGRLSYMLENAGSHFLMTKASADYGKLGFTGKTILLDTEWNEIVKEAPTYINIINPSGLAYVIYTSGSTGQPKGVQTTQRGLVNFLCSMKNVPGFSKKDLVLSITSICFDPFTVELFLPLVAGGKVEIIPFSATRDGNALKQIIEKGSASIIQATPSTWQMLLAAGWKRKLNAKLLCGGEVLNDDLAETLLQRGEELWNIFGPTEATVWSAVGRVWPGDRITVGRPIDNIMYYVIDPAGNPVPAGVPGELYIGGEGLSPGYMNRPDLTSASFIPNTFDTKGSTRLYKSGDLVRLLHDGRVEYLGRVDHQVKLRGFRIELGEVEAALKRLEWIQNAAVVVRTDSEEHKHLFAFLISDGSTNAEGEEIALRLKKWLPAYMIPSRFIYLQNLPLTPSCKVDRKLLSSANVQEITGEYGWADQSPIYEQILVDNTEQDMGFSNDINRLVQEDLLNIIANILKIKSREINTNTNLGEYGFDSIRFTTLSAKLNAKYGISVSPALFYEYSTIKSITALLINQYTDAVDVCYRSLSEVNGVYYPMSKTSSASWQDDLAASVKTSASIMNSENELVAIIGVSGKMPQSANLDEFWENLIANKDLITEIPQDRWNWKDYYGEADKEANKTRSIWGGFIKNVDMFDAAFFGISPREAELMDPQQRLFLEAAWQAIEDAGYRASTLSGTKTGVFVGVGGFDYWRVQWESLQAPDGHTLSGLAHSIIANRVSYFLNLKGPSASIDTACSSSLVSIHRAVKAIQGGLCDMALAGGVNVLLSPFLFIASDRGGMMSKDGRCKTFDSLADGYVRGEGVGALLLKPLSKARADGDYIYAVIRGSAENHGGRTNSLTAPDSGAQADLIVEAFEEAGLDPATITYIETHGTGTSLGDPIEINGLTKAFEDLYTKWDRPAPIKAHCGLGSVKTNIGHLEAAAGISGVLKVLLAMRHKKLPGILHFREQNPYINLENSPFYIVRENIEWERLSDSSGKQIPRRAGISSFGFGGSNAHIVIEEYQEEESRTSIYSSLPLVFVLSAKNGDRLKEYAGRLVEYLNKTMVRREFGADSIMLSPRIEEELKGLLSHLLTVNADDILPDERFYEYGLDRVCLTEFASLINEKYKVDLSNDRLIEMQSIRKLAQHLGQKDETSHITVNKDDESNQVSLADIAYTLQTGREIMGERMAIVASSADELVYKLNQFIKGKDSIDGIFRNNSVIDENFSGMLFKGDEGREFTRIIVKDRKLDKLARIWVAGAEIDWKLLYPDCLPKRVPLPTYPFARERFWIPQSGSGEQLKTNFVERKKDQEAVLYFKNKWVAAGINAFQRENSASRYLWIFDTEEGLFQALQDSAQTETGQHFRLVLVKPGDGYKELGNGKYEINPEDQDDYSRLAEELSRLNMMPVGIIHRWSSRCFSDSPEELNNQIKHGILSIFYLSRAIMQVMNKEKVRILFLYPTQEGYYQPQHAAVSGYARTIRLEYPRLDIRTLELYSKQGESFTIENSQLAEIVIKELGEAAMDVIEVRYDNGLRLVKRIEEFNPPVTGEKELPLRDRGVYIITGGVGGIGLIFAEYLAVNVKARLVLSGRSKLNSEKKEKINRLEDLGAEVTYVKADVTRRDDVEKLVALAKTRFGGINGIIHAAGVIRDSLVFNKTDEDFKAVIAPKVFGTLNLDDATKDEQLDFFVLFSSNSAVIGSAGQCDYAYSNSFLDSYAEIREVLEKNGMRKGKSLSLSWPLWKDGGMKTNPSNIEYLKRNLGFKELTSEAGLRAFERGLISKECGVIVISGNRQRFENLLNNRYYSRLKTKNSIQTGEKALKNIEQVLVRLSSDILKVREQEIDVKAKMNDYGFDSICLIELAHKINSTYDLGITPAAFYEYTTLRSLSGYLMEEYGQKLVDLFNESKEEIEKPGLEDDWNEYLPASADGGEGDLSELSWQPLKTTLSPVAVIGMGGVMPQSEDLEEFWQHLMEGRDLITEIPEDRWNWREYYGDPAKEANKSNSRWGGFVRDIDKFDASFFDIPDGEADLMDPQQRLFLETVWKTIEDAGYRASHLSGTKTGVFVGVATLDYNEILLEEGVEAQSYTSTGISHSVLANRVSYLLNLRGPSKAINTACSSSLVAIQMGMEALGNGTCEMVIAGGVNAILSPNGYIYFGKSGVLSSVGKCRAFDRNADGYVRGEGCGAILLKSLNKAIKDKDRIYGVICGAAVNHGGHSASLTAPSPKAQVELLINTYENAGIDPSTVTYIEAHGTGTNLGDSIEVGSLKKAFKEMYYRCGRPWPGEARCGLGTVKTNIGHLETAAGIAGVIKVLLAMKNGLLPANIHFNELNPYIRLEDSPFYIVDSNKNWERLWDDDGTEIPRRAGISSFGFGGTNAHVVIEEYIGKRPGTEIGGPYIFVLSAANEDRLNVYAEKLLVYLEKMGDNCDEISLADVVYTLQVGREAMAYRIAAVVTECWELKEILTRYTRGAQDIDGLIKGNAENNNLLNAIVKGEDSADFIRSLVTKKRYEKLAHIWTMGGDVDWELLYPFSKPRRISLPTYPFARERHWFHQSIKNTIMLPGREFIHPLINRNISTFKEERFETTFSGSEFVLSDHVVAGQKIMPGAAFLEIARAAGEMAGERRVRRMTNIVWLNPLVLDGSPREVFTSLRLERGGVEYELHTSSKNNIRMVHSKGKIYFQDDEEDLLREKINIPEIIARCPRVIDREECYGLLRKTGFWYGPSFKVITELFSNERESLSRLELPLEADKDHRFVLHPSLLDGAIQTIVGLMTSSSISKGIPYLPFAIKELVIQDSLFGSSYVYCTYASDDKPNSELKKFNITIMDENGTVLVMIKDYTARPGLENRLVDNKSNQGRNDFDEMFYIKLLEKLARGEITPDDAVIIRAGV